MCTPLPTQITQKSIFSLFTCSVKRVSVYLYLAILLLYFSSYVAQAQVRVGQWDRFEASLTNKTAYKNAYRDVTLNVTYTKPDGSKVNFWGFYDGNSTWRIRFMPDQLGKWTYKATFSDGSPGKSGSFTCVASSIPGMISKDETNPRWFGYKGGKHILVRSFHGGPPLLAYNFSDTKRKSFLEWVDRQGYNMLSVNNFQETGYNIPDLWPLDARAYRQIEKVLNDLAARKILFYSFGGLLPRDEKIPTTHKDEILLVRYYLARLAPYWNILLNVSGSEANYDNYISSSKVSRVGAELQKRDVFKHLIGNHNKDGDDPYRHKTWVGFSTLQVEITDLYALNAFLLKNHTGTKPVYAQENLWPGNTLQPARGYSATTIRKHAWVHMLSATTLNYGDMDGKNYSGFSGSLNLADKLQARHDIVDKVWDFMETLPFYKMNPSQRLVSKGFCLAQPGQQYLVYLPARGAVSIAVEPGKTYAVRWINGQNPLQDQRSGGTTTTGKNLASPRDGDDWLVYLTVDNSSQACNAKGSILREYWANVRGGKVTDIPVGRKPSSSSQITSFETPSNRGENYAQRIRGYICAPATGSYRFYLASDDQGELWLSTSESPANKRKIAHITEHASSREWNKHASQKSVAITLQKGKKYYIEALHKESVYGDNLAVGWTVPGSSSISVIPGSVLSPFVPSAARLAAEEELQVSPLLVYPNPFSDKLTIATSGQEGKVTITLTDVVGKSYFVKEYVLTGQSEVELDLTGLSLKAGIHLLKLQTAEGETRVIKVIKK
ncbi:DUF5060 domain-containing protein [Rhodocytophaga aerolata]|uniref:DUF5060 domain-containing protein n=1 Tax=Rhodocytophaga aerolata TaxID=455078 RepID=A0ABT8RDH5_9BACT|nr:DUF5060 domain-containing protein [Rhodocytophaga aerolata]MDO1450149.1 DUF5060 domain-containing protein [Rhodocytophaga aerolata]